MSRSSYDFALHIHESMHSSFCASLSEELHRDICQKLTAAKLELDIMALDGEGNDSLERARAGLSDSITGIRELMEVLAGGL